MLNISPDISYVVDRFPKAKQSPWLAKRLGNATAQRRQMIQYRRLHRDRLAKRKENTNRPLDGNDTATIAGTAAASTIATTFIVEQGGTGGSINGGAEEHDIGERMTILTSATSFLSIGEDENIGRRIPDLFNMTLDGVRLQYGVAFECPYCRTIQRAANRHEWK